MQIPPLSSLIHDLSQQNGTAVPQLRYVMAKLVSRIEHGDRIAPG